MIRAHYTIIFGSIALFACSDPASDWEAADRQGTLAGYQEFFERHAGSEFAAEAEMRIKELHWPPLPLPEDQARPDSVIRKAETGEGSGWGHVYEDATKRDISGWGMAVGKGMLELGHNVFAIPAAGPCYVENRFEVVNYDSGYTLLRFDPEQRDSLVIANEGIGNLRSTAGCLGTIVRFDEREYELRADGWYVNDSLVHEFD